MSPPGPADGGSNPPPNQLAIWSVLGAVILNLIISVNHRRDRYIAT